MRVMRISCNKCGRDISENPIKVFFEMVDREYGEIVHDRLSEINYSINDVDLCDECMMEVIRYVSVPAERARQKKAVAAPEAETKEPEKRIDTGKIMALHRAGWSQAKIADEMGVSQGRISQILKELKAKEEASE